jgi:S-adenosylmethionine synthetase
MKTDYTKEIAAAFAGSPGKVYIEIKCALIQKDVLNAIIRQCKTYLKDSVEVQRKIVDLQKEKKCRLPEILINGNDNYINIRDITAFFSAS